MEAALLAAQQQLIVALDFPSAAAALQLVDRLEGRCCWFKVGLELFIAEGTSVVDRLVQRGCNVFLDLKLHDIPNTVARAVGTAAGCGASLLTVHASGGPAMLHAAQEAARGTNLGLLGVTVLTSMDQGELEAAGVTSSLEQQVQRLARLTVESGLRGLVCSAAEAAPLRRSLGKEPLLVVPGIRPAGASQGDQRRIATPSDALRAGASMLVVGRPITEAADPVASVDAILLEMGQSSAS